MSSDDRYVEGEYVQPRGEPFDFASIVLRPSRLGGAKQQFSEDDRRST